MGYVVVDVMPKSAELDPMGRLASGAMRSGEFREFVAVRQGKRFVLSVDGPVTADVVAAARQFADRTLLTPGVDQIVSVREAGDATALDDDIDTDWSDLPVWGAGDTPTEVGPHTPRARGGRHTIDESTLGQVQAGSYYGRADDVR